MHALIHCTWIPIPLMALGAALVLASTRYVAAAVRAADPQRALWIARGFRVAVVGFACLGVGAGWWWEIGALVGLSLIIGGEELLESTVVIQALKDGSRAGRRLPPRSYPTAASQPAMVASRSGGSGMA